MTAWQKLLREIEGRSLLEAKPERYRLGLDRHALSSNRYSVVSSAPVAGTASL